MARVDRAAKGGEGAQAPLSSVRCVDPSPRRADRFHGRDLSGTLRPPRVLIEPRFTLAELRARVPSLDRTPWGNAFLDELHLAGLPEQNF
jgi:hypothetical protein